MHDNPILAFEPKRRTNARAVAELAHLGILRPDDRVLDVTVGPKRGFWTEWRPQVLATNDSDPDVDADYHHDGVALPFGARTFDVVVWDPPYKYQGADRLDSNARYGLTGAYLPADEIDARLLAGTVEALRVASRLALVKCQDQCVSGRFRDQTGFVADLARQRGARVAGKLYVGVPRSQPVGKMQLNIWGYPSTLLVLEVEP